MRGTIWAVSHSSRETLDIGDYRLLNSLADSASIAVRHQHQQESLRKESDVRASAAKANELAHEINNPVQSLTNALYLASQGGETAQGYVQQASGELRALSELVARWLIVSNGKNRISGQPVGTT